MKKVNIACVIDDDPIFVFGIKKILEISGFCEDLMIFENGKKAINSLKPIIESGENIPEVILLDLNMPIMDGWQFLDEFVKIRSESKITVFIVSSSIDPSDQKKAESYSAVTDFIIKPVTFDDVKNILSDLD